MITDEDLIQKMATGDQAAFEAFVHRYHTPLQGYLERLLRDADKAEDLVQETFMRLLRQLKLGKVPEQIRPWMYRVASNLCKDYWKSTSFRREGQALGPEIMDHKDMRPSVVEIYERQETRKELLRSLDDLPDVQRQMIILRFYQDLKLKEMAEVTDLPLSSVKTHLYNGLKRLKKNLIAAKPAGKEGKAKCKKSLNLN